TSCRREWFSWLRSLYAATMRGPLNWFDASARRCFSALYSWRATTSASSFGSALVAAPLRVRNHAPHPTHRYGESDPALLLTVRCGREPFARLNVRTNSRRGTAFGIAASASASL